MLSPKRLSTVYHSVVELFWATLIASLMYSIFLQSSPFSRFSFVFVLLKSVLDVLLNPLASFLPIISSFSRFSFVFLLWKSSLLESLGQQPYLPVFNVASTTLQAKVTVYPSGRYLCGTGTRPVEIAVASDKVFSYVFLCTFLNQPQCSYTYEQYSTRPLP